MMYCGLQLSMKVNEYQQPRDPNSNFQVRKEKGKKARQWQTKPHLQHPLYQLEKDTKVLPTKWWKGNFGYRGAPHTLFKGNGCLSRAPEQATPTCLFFKTKVSLSWLLNYKKLLWKNKKAIWSRLKFLYFNGIFIILLCIIIFY
jgi:hypothetical protein